MKRIINRRKLLLGVTAIMLATTPIYSASYAATTTKVMTPAITAVSNVVKPVYLTTKNYIKLVDATLSPSDDGQVGAFTVSITNGSSSVLDLNDYWFRLTSLTGSNYTLKTSAADSKVTKISPNSKLTITLYANVGETTTLSDLSLNVVKFDFSVTNYEKAVGKFTFPKGYTNIVSSGSYKAIYFNNTTLNTKISSASLGASGDNNFVTINFVYNNIGKKAVTLSKYKYYLVNSNGIMYQATSSETEDIIMDPLERTEFQLTASIPASLKTTGWKLIVLNGSDPAVALPVGAFNLVFGGTSTSTSSDNFTYSNTNGKYQFNLLQLQREPWENQDILAARIRIQNKSVDSLDTPNVSGYFYLDDKVKLDFKTVAISNQFGINSGGYVDVDVYAKLPANYSFTTVKLIINNKGASDTTATKIGELSSTSKIADLPINAVDKVYNITRDGSQMTGTLNAVNIFGTTTTNLFTVQMTLTSAEKRTIDPAKLVGLFKNDNGDIFPATTVVGTGKVNPLNKALISFTASVPKDYNTSNLRLIVGEAVTDTSYSGSSAVADAYVNPVVYNLPAEQRLFGNYKEIPLLPYKLSINTFTPTQLGDNVKITFNYDLVKDTNYNVYPTNGKLSMDVVGVNTNDGTEYTYFTQELVLEGDTANALQAGTDQEISFEKANPYNGVDASLKFKVRLFETVDGAKKLIAERPLDFWYIDNDWSQDLVQSN
jgi:hypothetical protein